MYKIGITGSIGTGKSSIANIFALFNIPIFDADEEIKKILSTKQIIHKLKKVWPEIVRNNYLDKHKLKSIVFSNSSEKKKLEKLLYPQLKKEKDRFENANHLKKILVYDVPLIYETNSERNYDLILLTYCDSNTQRKRVLKRDKISDALYEKIVKSQLSFKEKIKFNPKIINTNRSKLIIYIRVILLLIKVLVQLRVKNGKTEKINT